MRTFIFHNTMLYLSRASIIIALYIDLTINIPFCSRPHMNMSFPPVSLMCATLATSLNHMIRLFPTSHLQKEMFSGIILKIDTIETFLQRVIAYNDGYCYFKVRFPNHLSSQNHIFSPLLSWKWPRLKKDSLTFMRPHLKFESPGFFYT
jgi:hypothetical protein